MKKLLLFAAALTLGMFATSCSDDNDDNGIVGSWAFQSLSYDIVATPSDVVDIITENLGDGAGFSSATFKDDGTAIMVTGSSSMTFTYVYANNVLTLTHQGTSMDYNMIINGNAATMSADLTEKYDDEVFYLYLEEEYDITDATVTKVIGIMVFQRQ